MGYRNSRDDGRWLARRRIVVSIPDGFTLVIPITLGSSCSLLRFERGAYTTEFVQPGVGYKLRLPPPTSCVRRH